MPSLKPIVLKIGNLKLMLFEETFNENMTVISGIPSWVQMYFERLSKKGEAVGDILKISTCLFMGCQL
jgi:hypothetical protein